MPRFNGTGPAGRGPMTGWGMGYCGGSRRRGIAGRGLGHAWGRGRAFGGAAYGLSHLGPATKEDEMEFLKQRAEALEEELMETKKILQEYASDQG